MIKRLYVHNYRCLENFELQIGNLNTTLIIGKNGTGKSTVREVLRLLQKVGRGGSRADQLIKLSDMAHPDHSAPIRVEVEADLNGMSYQYRLAFEIPKEGKEVRVASEDISVDGETAFVRQGANVSLATAPFRNEASFRLDTSVIALPLIQETSSQDPLFIFRRWLAQSLILSPIPSVIRGESLQGTLEPSPDLSNLAEWFRELTSQYPASYQDIQRYLNTVMPDLASMRNVVVGSESRSLIFDFKVGDQSTSLPLDSLSDGEKCFVIGALVVASNKAYGPLLCFWDEPDNHIGISEVNRMLLNLRKAFKQESQFIATTHNPEAIRAFPYDKTLLFYRSSHVDPTRVKPVSEFNSLGDLSNVMIRDDIEF